MKYPASMMIGGRMTVKKMSVSNSMISCWSLLKYVIIPSAMPTTISRQLSGQRFSRRLLAWKPEPDNRLCQIHFNWSQEARPVTISRKQFFAQEVIILNLQTTLQTSVLTAVDELNASTQRTLVPGWPGASSIDHLFVSGNVLPAGPTADGLTRSERTTTKYHLQSSRRTDRNHAPAAPASHRPRTARSVSTTYWLWLLMPTRHFAFGKFYLTSRISVLVFTTSGTKGFF